MAPLFLSPSCSSLPIAVAAALMLALVAGCGTTSNGRTSDDEPNPDLPFNRPNNDGPTGDAGSDAAGDAGGGDNTTDTTDPDGDDVGESNNGGAGDTDVDPGDIPGGDVRVATYNVARFFDQWCDTNNCGPDGYEVEYDEQTFNARADTIAASIASLDADVVLLQEVEKQYNLDELMARLGDQYTVALIGETGGRASLDVAVIARGELIDFTGHGGRRFNRPGGGTTSFAREFLEVRLDIDGQELIVFCAHFKSKANDDPERRLLEAVAAQEIVTEVADDNPNTLIVLGGDLNDTPGSDPINALIDGDDLLRVASDASDEDAWTYRYFANKQAIDHLFHAVNGGGAYVPGSARAVRDTPDGLGDSDHSALVAEFWFQ